VSFVFFLFFGLCAFVLCSSLLLSGFALRAAFKVEFIDKLKPHNERETTTIPLTSRIIMVTYV